MFSKKKGYFFGKRFSHKYPLTTGTRPSEKRLFNKLSKNDVSNVPIADWYKLKFTSMYANDGMINLCDKNKNLKFELKE